MFLCSLFTTLCIGRAEVRGQGSLGDGTFQNLNFGSATVVFLSGDSGLIEPGPALPGWSPSINGAPGSWLAYNELAVGSSAIALLGPAPPIVGGNYSIVLQGGSGPQQGTVSIQQTRTLPVGANSIMFQSSTYPFYPKGIVAFGLNINSQPVNLVPLSVANNVWTYGGNISQYAGQSAALDFYSLSGVSAGNFGLGDITFSSQVIPEPSEVVLFGIGGLALVAALRARRNRNHMNPPAGCDRAVAPNASPRIRVPRADRTSQAPIEPRRRSWHCGVKPEASSERQ
jgi:hypothetical protein